jgi:integrase
MATSVFIKLNEKRIKKDKSYPIVFEIIHNRKNTHISTGYSVPKSNWNMKNNIIKKDCKNVPYSSIVNQKMHERLSNMMKIIAETNIDVLNKMSVTEVKGLLFKSKLKDLSFVEYANGIIMQTRKEGRFGTAAMYQGCVNFMIRMTNNKNLSFGMIDTKTLKTIEIDYMKDQSHHYNGLAAYLNNVKTLLNKAINENIISEKDYPFATNNRDRDKYRIKREKTRKRAISKSQIVQLENYEKITTNPRHKKCLAVFLFSFYLRGINISDVAKLKKSSVINNTYIQFRRSKTKRTFVVKINEKAWNILYFFDYEKKNNSDYLFPIIKHEEGELIKRDIYKWNETINRHLKAISIKLDMKVHLTTYVSRHSWATIADKAGIDRHIISKGLGHSDLQTTSIYLDDIVSEDDLLAADDIITG